MMSKNKSKIAPIVVAVLILALLLTYFLMSVTMKTINNISEKEALALLTENAMQMDNIIENQLINNWRQIDTVCVSLEHLDDHSVKEVVSFLQDAFTDTYDILLLSGDGSFLNKSGEQGSKQFTKDVLPLMKGEERILLLRQDKDTDLLTFGIRIKPLYVGEKKMEYLFVYYKLDSYMSLLKMESFGGNGQIRIIDSAGITLLHSDNISDAENRYMFFGTFKDAQFLSHDVIKDSNSFREYVLAGKSDAIHVMLDSGENEIISFSKIPNTDWHIVISIDQSHVMGTRLSSVEKISRTSLLAAMFIVLFSLLTISLVIRQSQKQTKAQNRELEKLNEQLRENNASLEEARHLAEKSFHAAEEANKAKSTFLSNMSHDIRTPMNAVIGFATLGMKSADNAEKVREYFSKILSSSNHLLSLINDILDISRIESGKTKLNPAYVDITEVADVVMDITKGFLSNRAIHFEVINEKPKTPYVLADELRIREVLVNILGNAVKFTDDGGKITFETAYYPGEDEHHIRVRYRVTDTGVGMSEDFVKHIFDEFSQEESSARTHYKGTGLGMAITKHYVELMNGSIFVDSKKGEGSTFIVELPLELSDESKVKKQDISADSVNMKGIKVLLAEDNDLNAEIAMVQLEEFGMIVTRVTDGKEVVELFGNSDVNTFDIIFMDIMMPKLNGYEATRAIRELKDHPKAQTIPIVAMTANAFAEDVQASLDAGMNGHLSKPIVMEDVIEIIARNIGGVNG